MNFFIKKCLLESEETDCIVLAIFESCEFSESLNYLNKCSNNYIASLVKLGDINGKIGETLLLYNVPNIISKRILLVGCGKKNKLNISRFKKLIKNSIKVLKKYSIKHIIYSFSELIINVNNNIYWIIRLILLSIEDSCYNIFKENSIKKNNFNIHEVVLNVLIKSDLYYAKISLQHALAISSGIQSAKNLSNLPPNICTPLYLSSEVKKLCKKYKRNISVEVIDIEQMKKLGMNAYVAVGNGSKNKPFMSIVRYSQEDSNINKKTIALVGKGVTFDSGGISIKPALNMHYMKYDMCGAAAVYGILTMVAKLQLPLTIIGILSGCENMPSGQSFRPGDVITTMSGKTVEILNTDAEGRLVLCDSLTYLERFSPDIVIDIATLTGACVTALGESISGLFTNDPELEKQLYFAAEQTNDKVWSLPLASEYQKDLISNIADLSNSGKSHAGAITAACFLANFTKKYKWAHLDIAGTAWKSSRTEGATGRPVELLCQFLLNQLDNYSFSQINK